MGARTRVDAVLVARGLAPSRTRAQALIMAGRVYSGERRLDKPGQLVADDLSIEVRGADHPWASRGGVKLAHALNTFAIDPAGTVALDIGSSTGGFCGVLLSAGARRVYAVDVGRGQLDWRLRTDARVVVLEGINARHLSAAEVPEPIDLVTCDVSFISLLKVLAPAMGLTAAAAALVALIKPQFEVGRGLVGKGGIVRDAALHAEVQDRVRAWIAAQANWHVVDIVASPIRGAAGNREFLIAARRTS